MAQACWHNMVRVKPSRKVVGQIRNPNYAGGVVLLSTEAIQSQPQQLRPQTQHQPPHYWAELSAQQPGSRLHSEGFKQMVGGTEEDPQLLWLHLRERDGSLDKQTQMASACRHET